MARPSRYSPEVRERAVRLFHEHVAEHPSPWAAMASIASKPLAAEKASGVEFGGILRPR